MRNSRHSAAITKTSPHPSCQWRSNFTSSPQRAWAAVVRDDMQQGWHSPARQSSHALSLSHATRTAPHKTRADRIWNMHTFISLAVRCASRSDVRFRAMRADFLLLARENQARVQTRPFFECGSCTPTKTAQVWRPRAAQGSGARLRACCAFCCRLCSLNHGSRAIHG